MNVGNIILRGARAHLAGQDYDEEQSRRAIAQRVRQYGIKEMDASEPLLAAHAAEVRAGLEDKSRVRGNETAYRQLASGGASFDELASEAQRRGDFKTAQGFLTTRRTMEAEGFKSLVTAALSGADGAEIERIYNSTGRDRVDPGSVQINQGTGIVTYSSGGQPGKLDAGKMGVLLGLVKPQEPKQTSLAPGAALAVDGKIVATNTEGLEARNTADLKKLDYEYGLKRDLETFKKSHGAESTTALMKNMEYLVKSGVAKSYKDAYSKLRIAVEKPESDAITSLASKLMQGSRYRGADGAKRAMEEATAMVRSVRGAEADDGEPSSGVNQPSVAPRTRTATGRTYNLRGKSFTDAEIESTAKKYGITSDQVKQRLGIR